MKLLKYIMEKLKIKPECLKSIEYKADYVLDLEEVVIDIENKYIKEV